MEDAINCGLGERGDGAGAGRLGFEEAAACWFVFSGMEIKGSKPGLDSGNRSSWTSHDGPTDPVYDDGGDVLGVVIELSTIELEVPDEDDDKRLFPRLACSEGETSASDVRELFECSLSLVVKTSEK